MSFFGNRNKEGAGLPLPEGGFWRYAVILATNFWKLVGLNLFFVAFSLPVITMPAALCGLNRVCMLLIRNGYCFLQRFTGTTGTTLPWCSSCFSIPAQLSPSGTSASSKGRLKLP